LPASVAVENAECADLLSRLWPIRSVEMKLAAISMRRRRRRRCLLRSRLKGKGSPYSITERGVPELIPVLGSQPAGDVSHKPDGRLSLLYARPAVTPATLKRSAANFAAW